MWVFDAGSGQPSPTYLADLKGASSVAHVHGKSHTGAESMTAFHRPWSYTPRRLKHVADLELALGVTRFCIHTSPHQPTQVPPPGIALAPQLGQAFVRTEPWAGMAGPWVDYLARCSWLLNQGEPAVDVAVFVGEEAPVTALFGDEPDRTLPPGLDFDYVDLEGLEQRVAVRDGVLVAAGARYRALVLGGSSRRMTVRALRCIAALVDAGAAVVGRRPEGSPSLADDDGEHARLCDELWGSGRVIGADDPATALQALGVVPRVVVTGAELLRIVRRIDGAEVLFLANPEPEPVVVRLEGAVGPGLVAWDPVTLRRTALVPDRRGGLRLELAPLGSVFLVPGGPADADRGAASAELVLDGPWQVHLPGSPDVVLPGDPRPWTELGPAGRGFAGVGTYTTEVEVDAALLQAAAAVVLTAADVGDLARLRVNGLDCGVVWTAPWEVEVTAALRPGTNTVEVEVANAWMNRLIAEATEPTGEIFAPAAGVYAPDAPINPAGLLGPVVLGFHGAPSDHDA
jgi:alpha-L-rhamnosidase